MNQQLLIRKKKRKKISLINEDIYFDEIDKKVFSVFKSHIGKANEISHYDLFEKLYGLPAPQVEVFKRIYLWNVIRKVLRRLRSEGSLFVIMGTHSCYVLQTAEELRYLNLAINNHIKGLNDMKTKADEWVKGEKWRKLI